MLSNINIQKMPLKIAYALIFLGALNSSIGSVTGGVACFSAGFLFLIFSQYHIAHFKFGILEAKLKDKLNEAEEILEKLRGISLPISEIAVISASQTGRYDLEVPRKKLYDYIFSISKELKDMGVEPDKIEKVRGPWYLTTAIDMALPIHEIVRKEITSQINFYSKKDKEIYSGEITLSEKERASFYDMYSKADDNQYHYNDMVQRLNENYKTYPDYYKDMIMGLDGIPELKRKEILEGVKEILLDLEFLISDKDIRRPDIWFNHK